MNFPNNKYLSITEGKGSHKGLCGMATADMWGKISVCFICANNIAQCNNNNKGNCQQNQKYFV